MRTLADLYFSKWLRTLERFNFADLEFLGFRLHICNLKNFGFHHLIKKIFNRIGLYEHSRHLNFSQSGDFA